MSKTPVVHHKTVIHKKAEEKPVDQSKVEEQAKPADNPESNAPRCPHCGSHEVGTVQKCHECHKEL